LEAGPSWSCLFVCRRPVEQGVRAKHELDHAFRVELSAFRDLSFRDALQQCDGVFEESRYPFEPNSDLSKYPVGLLMACSNFLEQFVAKLQTREAIQSPAKTGTA